MKGSPAFQVDEVLFLVSRISPEIVPSVGSTKFPPEEPAPLKQEALGLADCILRGPLPLCVASCTSAPVAGVTPGGRRGFCLHLDDWACIRAF